MDVLFYAFLFSVLINWTISFQYAFQTSEDKKSAIMFSVLAFLAAFVGGVVLQIQ